MSAVNQSLQIVRYADLIPCRSAFIDAHTPGSRDKENFTIVGAGVAENDEQHVHIAQTPGFNIGAAGQPPGCFNSLHSHRTAEVFFILKGRWRFFWGLNGDAGEVVLQPGDVFDIPTGIFRGFENIGADYGFMMSILGGDDAGGGVIWAPHVIDAAREHGLVLSASGRLFDTLAGQSLPPDEAEMPQLSAAELVEYPELPADVIVPRFIARYWDMMALAAPDPCRVVGARALIDDRPGFELELINRHSAAAAGQMTQDVEILMVMEGHWRVSIDGQTPTLAPGDTAVLGSGVDYRLAPSMSGQASLFRVRGTGDPAGPTCL